MIGGQSTFEYGQDHFSRHHADHQFGSTAPIQRDFGLRMPDGSFRNLGGVPSPSGVQIQTTLRDFGIR